MWQQALRCFCYNDKWNRCADSKSNGEGDTSIVFIASLVIGYFLVREVLKRTADLAESAAEICRTKDFSRQLELEESDAEFERLQLTLNELLEDVREEGHFAENVVQEMWMPVSVILTRSAWCLGDWRLSASALAD